MNHTLSELLQVVERFGAARFYDGIDAGGHEAEVDAARDAVRAYAEAMLAEAGPVVWEGGEEWEALAWQLCAEENGEEACSELVWEGGPIPEPWGDRWRKYEGEAKRMIALVRKHTAKQPSPAAEAMLPQWMDIASAPKDGTEVLLYWRHAGWRIGKFVSDETGDGYRCHGDECVPKNQHDCIVWMPLPPPPTDSTKGN